MPFLYVVAQTAAVFVLGISADQAAMRGQLVVAGICVFGWLAAAYFIWKAA